MPLGDYLEFDESKFRREKQFESTDTLLYIHNELTESNKKAQTVMGASIAAAFYTFGVGAAGVVAAGRVLTVNCKKREIIQAILRGRGYVFSVPADHHDLVLGPRPSLVRL
jgi:hypothetical protein